MCTLVAALASTCDARAGGCESVMASDLATSMASSVELQDRFRAAVDNIELNSSPSMQAALRVALLGASLGSEMHAVASGLHSLALTRDDFYPSAARDAIAYRLREAATSEGRRLGAIARVYESLAQQTSMVPIRDLAREGGSIAQSLLGKVRCR